MLPYYLNTFSLAQNLAEKVPTIKAQRVVIMVGMRMSDGEAEPYCVLKAITEVGIS